MYFSLLIIDLALIQILPEAMFVRNIECVSDSLWTMCWTAVQQFYEYLNQLWGNKFLLKNNSNLVKSSWAKKSSSLKSEKQSAQYIYKETNMFSDY